jgi:5'-3' exonuclease|tara:strand:+ start:2698 stop:3648 length:951 start_codon:yes stop_codon:yes gene_type:complete
MIIDALNQFLRAYIVNPTLSPNGDPIGGTVGFLKILQKLCREVKPDKIVICWDGKGGSRRRKLVNKNYKEGRKPLRLNRDIKNLTQEEELQNKVWQQLRTMEYLNNFPVIQLVSNGVEADDVISFVAQLPDFNGWQKVIVSSDKDFFQLLDDETVVLRPTQQEVLNKNAIIEKFGIHPTNFALARAIVGDKSDNLGGVKGIGLPTIAKRLPFLVEEKTYTIGEVSDYCTNTNSKLKAYQNIAESEDIIRENYQLMQLYSPSISVQTKTEIKYTVRNSELTLDKTSTDGMMLEDGIGKTSWLDLLIVFKKIINGEKE